MMTKMQVELAKSLYGQAHRAAEYAHAIWLLHQNLYRFWFPTATDAELEKMMAAQNEQYQKSIEYMKQMRDAFEQQSAEFNEHDATTTKSE